MISNVVIKHQVLPSVAFDQEVDEYVKGNGNSFITDFSIWNNFTSTFFPIELIRLVAMRDEAITGVAYLGVVKHAIFGKFVVSGPFGGLGGFSSSDQESTMRLLQQIETLCDFHKAKYALVRSSVDLDSLDNFETFRGNATYRLDLTHPEEVWLTSVDSKARNQTRKAVKSGYRSEFFSTKVSIDAEQVWKIINECMHDIGTPFHKKDFMFGLFEAYRERIHVVQIMSPEEKLVGASIFIVENETAYLLYSNSLKRHRAACAGNLLTWESIVGAMSVGAKTFDFGRSTIGSSQSRYKQQWGAIEQVIHAAFHSKNYGVDDLPSQFSKKFLFMSAVWSLLPIRVTNFIGPAVIRGIP